MLTARPGQRADHRLRDAAGHRARVGRAAQRHRVEHLEHAAHRADQAEQRRERHQHAQQQQVRAHRRVERARSSPGGSAARTRSGARCAPARPRASSRACARQDAREVPVALDHERPHHEAAQEDPDDERAALVDQVSRPRRTARAAISTTRLRHVCAALAVRLRSRLSASRPVLCSSRICTTWRDIDARPAFTKSSGIGDAEAEHRRDHRLADAVRHQPRIARARLGDALEGDDHADHGADQAEQRTGRDGEAQERLEALEPRHLAQHRLGDAQLDDLGVLLDASPGSPLTRRARGRAGCRCVGLVEAARAGAATATRVRDQVERLVDREQRRRSRRRR